MVWGHSNHLNGGQTMSLVKQVLLNADEELRYPTPSEIRMIQNFCQSGDRRIRIATTLAKNREAFDFGSVARLHPATAAICEKQHPASAIKDGIFA
jgi:hypothetical protein